MDPLGDWYVGKNWTSSKFSSKILVARSGLPQVTKQLAFQNEHILWRSRYAVFLTSHFGSHDEAGFCCRSITNILNHKPLIGKDGELSLSNTQHTPVARLHIDMHDEIFTSRFMYVYRHNYGITNVY